MIRVCEGVVNYLPSIIITKFLFVEQDAQQLNRGDGGVGVVELYLIFFCELGPVCAVNLFIATNYVTHRGRTEEVLLLEAQFFANVT